MTLIGANNIDNYTEDLFGLGKVAKEKKRAKIENIKSKAQSRLILAQQGISEKALANENARNVVGGVAGALTTIVGGLTGAGAGAGEAGAAVANAFGVKKNTLADTANSASLPTDELGYALPTSQPQKTFMQKFGIWIGVGTVVVIGAIVYFVKRKK